MKIIHIASLRWAQPVLATLLCLCVAKGADAQSLAPATTRVYDMDRPAYDPKGIRQSGFLIHPQASQIVSFNDNIFASDRRKESDIISTTIESISAASQWNRHSLNARVFGAQQIYTQHPNETALTFGAEGTGRIDIARNTFVRTDLGFVQQPQLRSNAQLDAAALSRPIFNTYNGAIGLFTGVDRWFGSARGEVRQITYASERHDRRNGAVYTYGGRGGFRFTDYFDLFVDGSYSQHDWAQFPDLRNFDLVTGLAGARFRIGGMFEAELSAGAMRQSFTHAAFDTLVTPTFNLQLAWNVTPLTSLVASGGRTVFGTETFCGGTPAACLTGPVRPDLRNTWESTNFQTGLQHEFRHNLLAESRFRYQHDVFDLNGLTNDTFSIALNARYLINRNWLVELEYAYTVRNANLPDDRTYNTGPFKQNLVALALRAAL